MTYLNGVKSINDGTSNKLVVVEGEPGIGKTTFAGTWPKPILYVEIGNDKGGEVLQGQEDVYQLNEPLVTSKVNGATVTIAKKVDDFLAELLANPNHGFATVILDPISSIQELMEKYYRDLLGRNLQFDEWGAIKNLCFNIFDKMDILAQRMNVVACTHTQHKDFIDDLTETNKLQILPQFSENTAKRLLKNAKAVIHLAGKKIKKPDGTLEFKRVAILGGHPLLPTKFRLKGGKTLDNMELTELTYDTMMDLVSKIENGQAATKPTLPGLKKVGPRPAEQKPVVNEAPEEVVETTTQTAPVVEAEAPAAPKTFAAKRTVNFKKSADAAPAQTDQTE